MKDISSFRRNYTLRTLLETDADANPILQFEYWLTEAIESGETEPNAMTLSTSKDNGAVTSRIVLLKKIKTEGFVFFTNYESDKAKQIKKNPHCALNFVWHTLERQVRIEGLAEKISPAESDTYFSTRPEKSKLGAWASPQSQVIPNREYLETLEANFEDEFKNKEISRPPNWGGYIIKPTLIEFWQGRSNRLHDRLRFRLDNNEWKLERLAP